MHIYTSIVRKSSQSYYHVVLLFIARTEFLARSCRSSPTSGMDTEVMEDVSGTNPEDIDPEEVLRKKVEGNPFDYDTHVAYITHLRGNLAGAEDPVWAWGSLEAARQEFAAVFPLSEGCPHLPSLPMI
jgi:hypothetical protein